LFCGGCGAVGGDADNYGDDDDDGINNNSNNMNLTLMTF
jgi:hypothetical protein